MSLTFERPPVQQKFDEDGIRNMVLTRRQLRTEWAEVIRKPRTSEENWSALLPFPNTYENAFQTMCVTTAHPHHAHGDRLCLFLNGTAGDPEPPEEVARWVETIGKPVAMKDFLSLSFAMDYDREGGSPQKPQTPVGALRAQAKPYGGSAANAQTTVAADTLAELCVSFLVEMTCYSSADCVVAMPPSDPSKQYNLPQYLAERISELWGRENLTQHVRTTKARSSIKALPMAQKLDTLLGTIEVDENVFSGKKVLLVDDLYQSGISMNYCGLLLLNAGARKIFGLACEKTCRNDDNVSGR